MSSLSNFIGQFGIELEIGVMSENDATRYVRSNMSGFNITHDASIQSDIRITNNGMKLLQKPPEYLPTDQYTSGAEIVSDPMEFSDSSKELIKKLTYMLEMKGEPEESYRESLHVHIDCVYNLEILKNIISLARYLEDMFYYIGGNGYTHRGMKVNEFLYCRPITNYGPTVVESNCGLVQVFTVKDLLESTSVNSFFNRLGGAGNMSISHMHPVRYFWCNPYSLLAHKTLEFRVFNKTLNPEFIWAEILLCRAFTRWAVREALNDNILDYLPVNSIFDGRSKSEILNTLYEFAENTKLKPEIVEILATIIKQTPRIIVPERYIKTHTRNSVSYNTSDYLPNKIPSSDIYSVEVDDIHARRGERR